MHMDGVGIDRAVLLTRVTRAEQDSTNSAAPPDRFTRFTSVDARRTDAIDVLRQAARGVCVAN